MIEEYSVGAGHRSHSVCYVSLDWYYSVQCPEANQRCTQTLVIFYEVEFERQYQLFLADDVFGDIACLLLLSYEL